ncbi:hypothetical protein HYFRA_00003338 [Hymenoscyphus fraxineus]|uniref:Endoplasmic reticulum transmembrane protein n=1 Tax=Hymenoscyphus fraxineus TaxID=746836 RepID=A0A9N9KS59_9HELO|nr:hypothetical protein HYFRA_00003338 [Hymenoscyphus fraxineus]
MTLYYGLVFMMLAAEVVFFALLVLPFPFKLRKSIFNFISTSTIVAKLQYGMKIALIFVLVLFIDSVNRVYRVQVELSEANNNKAGTIMGHERMEVQARKFYSQRNMYLCGFTLFLSIILNRTYTMILDNITLEAKVKSYESNASAGGPENVARLEKELAKKDRDLATLKKQVEGVSAEYNRLGDEKSPKDGTPKKDR